MTDEKKFGGKSSGGVRGPGRPRPAGEGAGRRGRKVTGAAAEGGGEQIAPRVRKKRSGRNPLRKIHSKKAPDKAAATEVAARAARAKADLAAGTGDTKVVAQAGLDGKQRRHLRGLGHALDPILHVGKEGVTEGVLAALVTALQQHELVKAKVLPECPMDRHEVALALAAGTASALVQVLGRTVLVYKRHPKEPKIRLPG